MTLEGNGINIIIDEITNCLIENATGKEVKTEVKKRSLFQPGLYKGMNFDWAKEFQNGQDVFSLHLIGRIRIEGLIAITPADQGDEAINVTLVESAPHNRGETPKHKGVGPHLFAIASYLSFFHGFEGYVMFDAKTDLIEHYKKTLGAFQVGRSQRMILSPETSAILVQKYFSDQQKGW
jgi:hypothetical protein